MHEIKDDVQAQTGAALAALCGKKGLEHMPQIGFRYAFAVIREN